MLHTFCDASSGRVTHPSDAGLVSWSSHSGCSRKGFGSAPSTGAATFSAAWAPRRHHSSITVSTREPIAKRSSFPSDPQLRPHKHDMHHALPSALSPACKMWRIVVLDQFAVLTQVAQHPHSMQSNTPVGRPKYNSSFRTGGAHPPRCRMRGTV